MVAMEYEISPEECVIEGQKTGSFSVLLDTERGIGIQEAIERARGSSIQLAGKQHAEYLCKHQEEIPDSWRDSSMFFLEEDFSEERGQFVLRIFWNAGEKKWYPAEYWFGNGFFQWGRILCLLPDETIVEQAES